MMLRRLSRLLLFNRFRLAYRHLRLHGSIVLLRLKTMYQQPSSRHKHDASTANAANTSLRRPAASTSGLVACTALSCISWRPCLPLGLLNSSLQE